LILPFQGANLLGRFLHRALPLCWDIKGFQPFYQTVPIFYFDAVALINFDAVLRIKSVQEFWRRACCLTKGMKRHTVISRQIQRKMSFLAEYNHISRQIQRKMSFLAKYQQ